MGGVQPPSIGGIIGSHDARLSRAERLIKQTSTQPRFGDLFDAAGSVEATHGQAWVYNAATERWVPIRPTIVPQFTFAGTLILTTSAVCPPHLFEEAWTSSNVRATLTAAATGGSSVFTLYKNGTSFTTITISGTATTATATIVEAFAAADVLTVACTTVGTGTPGYAAVKLW